MRRRYRRLPLCCAIIAFGVFIFYAFIWEPYCFFATPIYSNDISTLATSQISTYKPSHYPSSNRDLITVLVPRISSRLIERLELVDQNFMDNFSTNLLLMHSNTLSKSDMIHLTNRIKRQVLFLDISIFFNLFPIGFDPCKTKTSYRVRGKWNYLLMIRFWFKILFQLPQLRQYDYIMRLDDDSKIKDRWINVFDEMRRKKAVYFANNVDVDLEEQLPGTMLLRNATFDYIEQNKIIPKQSELLRTAFRKNVVINYYNNFEVIKMEFFRRDEIRHWIEAIDSTNGIFYYRWGDAILRYLTMAIFAEPQEVLHRLDYNLSYCHKCP